MISSLQSITWESTSRCNLRCAHCARSITSEELSTNDVLKILDDSVELGTTYFTVAGGEPLLRKDIFEILDHASDLGMSTEVLTNGTLLTEKIIKKFEKALVNNIRISLDYADKDKFDGWRGYKGTFEQVNKGLKLLSDSSMNVGINTTVTLDNLTDINDIMKLAIDKNVNYIRFAPIVSVGSASRLPLLSVDDWTLITSTIMDCAEKNSEFIKYQDYKQIPYNNVSDYFALCCPAGIASLDIMPDGGIRGCPFLSAEIGNINKSSLREIWNNGFMAIRNIQNLSIEGKCKTCSLTECKGGCIAERIIRGGFINEQKICMKDILTNVILNKKTLGSRKIISGCLDAVYILNMSCLRNLPIWTYVLKIG